MSNKKLPKLLVKRLTNDSRIPETAKEGDAGFDLYASKSVVIPTNTVGKVPTGIAIALPKGYWAKFHDRSGFFSNVQGKIGAGVIDNGYRGELIVCMYNGTNMPLRIEKGEKFAQFTLHKLEQAEITEVTEFTDSTERGDTGFGSTD